MLLAQEARFAGERGEQKKILAELLEKNRDAQTRTALNAKKGCIDIGISTTYESNIRAAEPPRHYNRYDVVA